MSVNSTGAIGYEAKTDPKGRVTVTYQGKTTTYKNYNEFVELFKKQYDAEHPPVKDEKGTTVQKKGVNTDRGNITAYQIKYKEGDKEKTTSDFTFDINAPKGEQQKIKKGSR